MDFLSLSSHLTTQSRSARAQNQVNAAFSLDDIAHLSRLKRECGVLERLLHLAGPEPAEVAALLR